MAKSLCQDKIKFGNGGFFFSLFSVTKIKVCVTINEYGVVGEKALKVFGDVSGFLEIKKILEMQKSKKVTGKVSSIWKKSFETRGIIPSKDRLGEKCNDKLCEDCELKAKPNK